MTGSGPDDPTADQRAGRDEPEELVLVERAGRVAILQLNRPHVLNALSPQMMNAILSRLVEADRDPTVGAVIIAGHDRAFVAGADIAAMQHRPLADVLVAQASRFWFRLTEIEVPLIAAVSGPAVGGGCELALACDLVVASETARFSQAEIRVGIMPGGGGTQRLARTIGKHKAMELVLTGRVIDAHEAARLGIVNRVVDAGSWRGESLALADEIAAGPPLATRLAKRAVLAAEEAPLTAGLQLERRLMELTFAGADRVEGMSAFLERRTAQWTGT